MRAVHWCLIISSLFADGSQALSIKGMKSGNQHKHKQVKENDVKDDDKVKLRYETMLGHEGGAQLSWDIDPATEVITFRLEVETGRNSFIGFGFSDRGEPTNADWLIFSTSPNNKHLMHDAHTDSHGEIQVDEKQDYHLDNIDLDDSSTTFTFHRLYDTCDDDDYIIDSGTTHVLWFIEEELVDGGIEGKSISDLDPQFTRVQLLKSQLPDPPLPDDMESFVVHVDNVKIPEEETTYWFAVRKLPDFLKKKHHIVKWEGALSHDGHGIIHHIEVFHCQLPADQVPVQFDQKAPSMSERPKGLESCRNVLGAWAMGAPPLTYPADVGQPMGGEDFSLWAMLEIHYNNPMKKKGLVDSSGIRFYYTRHLRKYDAGIMELGVEYTDKLAVPPGQTSWPMTGYCIDSCTETALPEGGIMVFASQLHAHLTGRQLYTKHFRGGAELPELNRDNHFSSDFQEIRKLQRPVHVLPGDALVTVCEDYTKDKKKITLGGFSISDEMCVNYIHYYPKVSLEVCKSSVTTDSLYGFFNFMKEYQGEKTSSVSGISDNYKAIRWTPMNSHLLRHYYDHAPLSMQCNQSNGMRFPGEWEKQPVTQILHPLPPAVRPCLV